MRKKPTRRTFLGTIAAAAFTGLSGCGAGSGASEDPTPTTSMSTSTPTPTTAETATPTVTPSPASDAESRTDIQMLTDNKGSYFDPIGLLVEPGTTIRFINSSGTHATAAYHPEYDRPLRIPEAADPWDSGLYTEKDQTFEVTLDTEGVYDFYCEPHESLGMVGRIVVGEPQGGPGTTSPEALPPAAREALPSIESILEEEIINGP